MKKKLNNNIFITEARQVMKSICDGVYNPTYGRLNFLPIAGMVMYHTSSQNVTSVASNHEQPSIPEEDFWSYGRPFDGMKIGNLDDKKRNFPVVLNS